METKQILTKNWLFPYHFIILIFVVEWLGCHLSFQCLHVADHTADTSTLETYQYLPIIPSSQVAPDTEGTSASETYLHVVPQSQVACDTPFSQVIEPLQTTGDQSSTRQSTVNEVCEEAVLGSQCYSMSGLFRWLWPSVCRLLHCVLWLNGAT